MLTALLTDWKSIAAIAAALLSVLAYFPYLNAILKRETEPHMYTWLIWFISISTASAGVWYGGGGWLVTIGFVLAMCMTFLIFLLSFKYGTKNITRNDGIILILALIGVFVWWGLNNPVVSICIITLVDFIAYIPTYRKSLEEPWSEDLLAWLGYMVVPFLSLCALLEYNILTVTYDAMTFTANTALVILLIARRKSVPK